MYLMANGVPLVSDMTKQSKNVLKNEAIIAVLSASIVAPFVVPKINSLMDTVPILRDHNSIASFISGLVIFGIAASFKKPMLRAVVIGVAGAFVLSALLPIYSSLTTRNGGQ